jgi:hypothetical protein
MPSLCACPGVSRAYDCPSTESSPSSGGLYAGDDLHQRRFSRTVTAHQRMHLARTQREINAF